MRLARVWLGMGALLMAGVARAQTPAAPTPPPTLHNSTAVPAAPVSAGQDGGTVGEMPIDTPGEEPRSDSFPAASPVLPARHGVYLVPGTLLQLRLLDSVSTGQQHNGDVVRAALLGRVRLGDGKLLPAGTPVDLTVLSAAAAGTMQSYGVLSLQVLRVGGVGVYSNVLEFNGQEGAKVLPDSAPAKGTEARVSEGAVLGFKVLGAGNQWDAQARSNGRGGVGGRPGSGQAGGQPPASGNDAAAPGNSPQNGVASPAPAATQPH